METRREVTEPALEAILQRGAGLRAVQKDLETLGAYCARLRSENSGLLTRVDGLVEQLDEARAEVDRLVELNRVRSSEIDRLVRDLVAARRKVPQAEIGSRRTALQRLLHRILPPWRTT